MLCDELSKLSIFENCVSGHIHDNTSFRNVTTDYWDCIKSQYKELHYLTGESALCTSPIAKEAKVHGIKMVTLFLKNDEAEACRELLKAHPEQLISVDENNLAGTKVIWCGEGRLGDETLKKLLVQNELMFSTKKRTITKSAEKDLEKIKSLLRKLCTRYCKCKADAQQAVQKIIAKLQLVKLTDEVVCYEEVQKYSHKERLGNDEQKETVAVKVHAQVQLNESAIGQKIKEDTYYAICTNDLSRKWTMAELIGVYKKQSVVECNWRCFNDKKLLINAIHL